MAYKNEKRRLPVSPANAFFYEMVSCFFFLGLTERDLPPKANDQRKGQNGGEQIGNGLGQLHTQNAVKEGGKQQDQRKEKQPLA